jgi:hypothetical protein
MRKKVFFAHNRQIAPPLTKCCVKTKQIYRKIFIYNSKFWALIAELYIKYRISCCIFCCRFHTIAEINVHLVFSQLNILSQIKTKRIWFFNILKRDCDITHLQFNIKFLIRFLNNNNYSNHINLVIKLFRFFKILNKIWTYDKTKFSKWIIKYYK